MVLFQVRSKRSSAEKKSADRIAKLFLPAHGLPRVKLKALLVVPKSFAGHGLAIFAKGERPDVNGPAFGTVTPNDFARKIIHH
jgi:hypothetical protein